MSRREFRVLANVDIQPHDPAMDCGAEKGETAARRPQSRWRGTQYRLLNTHPSRKLETAFGLCTPRRLLVQKANMDIERMGKDDFLSPASPTRCHVF
jgi:hypothetical protein